VTEARTRGEQEKRRIILALFIFGALVMGLPQAKADVIAEGALATDYIWRGFDNLNGGPAFQPNVTWVHPRSGIDVNAWFNWGLTNRGRQTVRDFDEIDLTAAFTRPVGSALLRAGVFHLSWYTRQDWPDDYSTVNEVFAGVSRPDLPLSPSLTVNYELAATDGHDLYVQARLGREVAFGASNFVFLGLSAGYFAAEWVGKNGVSDVNLEIATTLPNGPWALTPRFMVTWVPLREINPNHLIVWAGLSITRVWATAPGNI